MLKDGDPTSGRAEDVEELRADNGHVEGGGCLGHDLLLLAAGEDETRRGRREVACFILNTRCSAESNEP